VKKNLVLLTTNERTRATRAASSSGMASTTVDATAVALFIACSTLGGRGTIPHFPEEIRRLVYDHCWRDTACSFSCRCCPRILCVARVGSASSYHNLLCLERLCLDCFSATLT